MLFGKKKESGIPVMHYEGIPGIPQNYPCRMELQPDQLEIRRTNPAGVVTLPAVRILQVDTMPEVEFMSRYHGAPVNTAKVGIKYFLVVTYQSPEGAEKYLAFWAAGKEAKEFLNLREEFQRKAPASMQL